MDKSDLENEYVHSERWVDPTAEPPKFILGCYGRGIPFTDGFQPVNLIAFDIHNSLLAGLQDT